LQFVKAEQVLEGAGGTRGSRQPPAHLRQPGGRCGRGRPLRSDQARPRPQHATRQPHKLTAGRHHLRLSHRGEREPHCGHAVPGARRGTQARPNALHPGRRHAESQATGHFRARFACFLP